MTAACVPWEPWSPWDSSHPRSDICRFVDYQAGVKAMECRKRPFALEVVTYSSRTHEVRIDARAAGINRFDGKFGRLDDGTWYSDYRLRWNGEDIFTSQQISQP
jgi:hypothetical protein